MPLILPSYGFSTVRNVGHVFVPLVDERTHKLAMVRQVRRDLCGGDVGVMLGYLAMDDEIDIRIRDKISILANSSKSA